uniref:CHK domain-containing protein n=1 Tax=Parastrongyloides trichosuri TaxID=131310 RepID=A0A0N4ZDM2_PARTI
MEEDIKNDIILPPYPYTNGWAYKILKETDPEFKIYLEDGMIKRVLAHRTGKGKGCFSTIYELIFVNIHERGYSCIIKIPEFQKASCDKNANDDKFHKKMEDTVVMMHNRECEFYNIIQETNLQIPAVFAAIPVLPDKQKGLLLMKNLNHTGAIQNISDSLLPAQMFQIMKYLAKLHTYSITHEHLFVNKNYSCMFSEMDLESWYVPLKSKIKEVFGHVIGEIYDEFIDIATNTKFHDYVMNKAHLENGIPSLLIHGDVYTHNIFFRKDRFGNTTTDLLAIFDWQTMQLGSPLLDIARCITLSLDGDIRRRIQEELLLYYYDSFNEELGKYKINPIFRYDAFRKVYDITFLQQSGDLLSMVDIFILKNTQVDKNAKYYSALMDKTGLKLKHAIEDSIKVIRTYFNDLKY